MKRNGKRVTNKKKVLSKTLIVLVSTEQYEKLKEQFASTTYNHLSEYIRDLLDRKPVTIRYRNQSLDEFLLAALSLKSELLSIARNVNRAIEQLNRQPLSAESRDTIDFLAAEEFALREKMDEIKNLLAKSYQLWSQK
jgi:hypothetical protein